MDNWCEKKFCWGCDFSLYFFFEYSLELARGGWQCTSYPSLFSMVRWLPRGAYWSCFGGLFAVWAGVLWYSRHRASWFSLAQALSVLVCCGKDF